MTNPERLELLGRWNKAMRMQLAIAKRELFLIDHHMTQDGAWWLLQLVKAKQKAQMDACIAQMGFKENAA